MFSISCEWIDRQDVLLDEYEATFSRFSIQSNNIYLTQVRDTEQVSRSYIHIPAYPVAEWLAFNWWSLFHEVENPLKRNQELFSRHNLLSGSDGYAVPNIMFYPQGKNIEILCSERNNDFSGLIFENRNQAFSFPYKTVQDSISTFIESTIARLEEKNIFDTQLQKRWQLITQISTEEECFASICGMLGLDPFDIDIELSEKIIQVYEKINDDAIEDFFSMATIDHIIEQEKINRKFFDSAKPQTELSELAIFKEHISKDSNGKLKHASLKPWERGYTLARACCKYFDITHPVSTPSDMFEKLGTAPDRIQDSYKNVDYRPGGKILRKVIFSSFRNEDGKLGFSLLKASSQQQNFYLTRAIYAYLASDDTYRIITPAHTVYQQESRAFGAEFLVPSIQLKKRLRRLKTLILEDIDELDQEYNVSPEIIRYQIKNHMQDIEMQHDRNVSCSIAR